MRSRTFLLCLLGVLIASTCDQSYGRVIKSTRAREVITVDGRVHTPQQITKIIDQSALAYIIEPVPEAPPVRVVATPAPPMDAAASLQSAPPLTAADFERQRISPPPDTIAILLRLGDKAASSGQYERSRDLYRRAFALDTTRHTALEGIARTFVAQGRQDSAIAYYEESLRLFVPDFETHRELGETFWVVGETEDALRELTIAHVLNPNDAVLRDQLKTRRARVGQPWRDWAFVPHYRVIQEGQAIRVQSDTSCVGYALVKALWASEPGYATAMLNGSMLPNSSCNLLEEQEAVEMQAVSDRSGDPLEQVVRDGLTKEFVLYEMALPRDPKLILSLDWPTVLRVADYVTKFH